MWGIKGEFIYINSQRYYAPHEKNEEWILLDYLNRWKGLKIQNPFMVKTQYKFHRAEIWNNVCNTPTVPLIFIKGNSKFVLEGLEWRKCATLITKIIVEIPQDTIRRFRVQGSQIRKEGVKFSLFDEMPYIKTTSKSKERNNKKSTYKKQQQMLFLTWILCYNNVCIQLIMLQKLGCSSSLQN